jgi:iron-sulfur cluster repair protein YtfE (RIC family)
MTSALLIRPEDTVNAVVQRYPGTLPILARLGVDRCCGGGIAIGAAARAHGLAFEDLLAKLQPAGSAV